MNDYYKNLPRKRMAAGALIFNDRNELLVVKPTYKDHWSIPGGTIDLNESPRQACIREIKEEIGINMQDVEFICVDYVPDINEKGESLHLMFYGGIFDTEDITQIKLDQKEIGEFKFVSIETAQTMLNSNLSVRLSKCIQAIASKKSIYLEQGK